MEQIMDYETAQKIFGSIVSGTIIAFDSQTVVPLLGGKSNPMLGRVFKHMTAAQAMVFGNVNSSAFVNMVRRRLILEGKDPNDYQPSERKWGTRIKGTAFVENKGEYYVEVLFLRPGNVVYYYNGQVIDKSEIIGFNPRDPSEESQGGLSNKVYIRTFKLASLISVRAFKQAWT
jgi:hypothetical protein